MAKTFSQLKTLASKGKMSEYRPKKSFDEIKSGMQSGGYSLDSLKADMENKIGFDSFEYDLARTNKRISSTYDGWQTPGYLNITKDVAERTASRIKTYNDYQRIFGNGETISDDVINYYNNASKGMGFLANEYGLYKDAESYVPLQDSLNELNQRISNAYGGWQDEDAMIQIRRDVKAMKSRVENHNNFLGVYGKNNSLKELINGLDTASNDFSTLAEQYSAYDNADAYNIALKEWKAAEEKREAKEEYWRSADIAKLETELRNYEVDLEAAKEYKREYENFENQWRSTINLAKAKGGDTSDKEQALASAKAKYEGYLSSRGFSSIEDYEAFINGKKAEVENIKAFQTEHKIKTLEETIRNKPDFAENSVFEKKDPEYGMDNVGNPTTQFPGYHMYNLINKDEKAREREMLRNQWMSGTDEDTMYEHFTKDEIAIYNYLWKTEGMAKANEYRDAIASKLRDREITATDEFYYAMSLEDPVGASFASVVSNVGNNMLALPYMALDYYENDKLDPNSKLYDGRRAVQSIRSAVENEIDNGFGQFVYRHGMNTADNLATMAMSGAGQLGGISKLLQAGMMGSSAFVDKTLDAKERGLSDAEAFTLGAIAFAAETFFESKTFDSMFDSDTFTESGWKYFVDNLKTELIGEIGTEATNDIADILVSQDASKWKLSIDEKMANGMSPGEAFKESFMETFMETLYKYGDIAAGTIFSTGVMSGTPAAVGSYAQRSENKNIGQNIRANEKVGETLDLASLSPEESLAYQAYTKYANKGINADNINDVQLGKLAHTLGADAEAVLASKDSTPEERAKAERILQDLDAYIENTSVAKYGKGKVNELFGSKDKVNALIENALAKGENTKAYKLATEYKAKLEKGKSLSEAELTKLVDATTSEVRNTTRTDAEQKLRELGETENAVELSKIISKVATGQKLSSAETEAIANNENARKVFVQMDKSSNIELMEASEAYEGGDAELFLENYEGGDIDKYRASFDFVSSLAKNNYDADFILEHRGALTPRQVQNIYSKVVAEPRAEQQRKLDELVKNHEGQLVRKANIDDSIFNGAKGQKLWRNLNSRQKKAITFVKAFAKGAGINLKITYNGKYNGKAYNGYYDNATNTIVIDARAGFDRRYISEDAIIPTLSHELTHWMKQKSPELYAKLSKQIFDVFKAKGYTEYDLIATEKQKHPDMSDEDARDEIIARASEDLFKMSEEGKKIFESLSESEQKTLVGKIKELIKNLVDWANELLGLYESKSDEAGWLREFKDELSEIAKTWDQMLAKAVEVNAALEGEGVLGNLENGISEDGTTIVGEGVLQMSEKTYYDGGRDYLAKWLKRQKGLTQKDKDDILRQTDKVAEIMRAVAEGNELPDYSRWANLEVVKDEKGEKVLSVIVKNGDYTMNIDFSQVCKKRVALNAVLNAMVQAGDLNVHVLTETDVADLNAIIKKHDFEIACALCFVDSKRYRVGAWAESFCEGTDTDDGTHKYGFNEMVRSLVPKGSKINVDEFNFTKRDIKNQPTKNLLSEASDSELDFSLIDKIMSENDVRSAQHRYARAIKENPQIRKILNSAEIISSIGLDAIRLEAPALYNIINGHQGTAKPKFSHDAVAYGNDVLKARGFTAKRAKMVGGVRCQSFSDFQANMIMDYAQFISELAAKKLTSHAYTKEPLFVKLFGMTGMKINMSLVPKAVDMTAEQQKQFAILKDKNADKNSEEYKAALEEYEKLAENAGLDENGNYIWEDETFPYDIAMEIVDDPRYSANCGTIAVGISKAHILKLLADDKISMVIPYHKSGLNRDVAMMRDIALYHDYTSVQNTRYANDEAMYGDDAGKKLNKDKGDKDFDFYGDLYGVGKKEGTHDPKKTAQNYLDWCDKHNYTPRFDEFRDHPNYYKLLVDFRVYDTDGTYREQQAVKAIYPEEAEFKDLILNGVKDKDGKVYGGLLQSQETSDRLKAETKQIVDEYREVLAEKYGQDVLGVQFSEKEIIGESGTNYGMGVYLDSSLLTNLTEAERKEMVKLYVKDELAGSHFIAYDNNSDAVDIRLAMKNEKIKKLNGKKQSVLKELYNKYNGRIIKQEAVVLADELIVNAKYSTSEEARYPHDWLDNYGQNDWEYWKVYIQEKNKTVWEATLNIANSANGEKILYDIDPIKMVEEGIKSPSTTTKDSIHDSLEKSNEEIVNNDGVQMSEKDTGTSAYDIMGEKKALEKRYDKLAADFANYKERVKLDKTLTKGKVIDPKQLEAVARYLVKFADSDYKTSELAKMLNDLYVDIQDGAMDDSMSWDEMYSKAYEVAKEIRSEAKIKIERPALYDKILKDIRSARIAPNDGQKGDAKHRFGDHYIGKFRDRVTIANDGTPLDIKWSEWAAEYPSVFDKDIGDAQQLVELYDLYDDLRNAGDVVQEYEESEVLQSLATEIINKAWTVTKFESTADKQNKRIQELNAEHRKAMEELKDTYKKKESDAKLLEQMYYGRLINDIKTKRHQDVAAAKQAGRERLAQYKENAERKVKMQSITNNCLTLNKWLKNNSPKEHIHDALKTPVINLLNAIDFSSKRMVNEGIPTNKDISLAKALGKVKDMMVKASNGHAEFVQLYGHGLDEKIEKMMESVDAMDRTIADNEFILQKMSLEDLDTLDKMVKIIKHAVSKLNKFHIANYAKGIAHLSQETVKELNSLGKGNVYDGLKGTVNKTLVWNNTLPYYAFKRYGEGGKIIFEAIQDGWDKFAFNVKEALDYAEKTYNTKEVDEWEKDVRTFKIVVPPSAADLANSDYTPEYQTVQMTIPQVMSLYCMQKREQAKKHLLGGGIRIADFTIQPKIKIGKGKIVSQTDGIVLTEKDIKTIVGSLTNRQKAVADKLQEFMNTVCTEWGNEVSMTRFGYKAFGEENYFPLKSDDNNIKNEPTDAETSLFRLLNMSFTKSLTEGANNRVVISNIFDVFAQHASDMAKYNALALPVLDAFKWYNYTEKQDVGDEGQFKSYGVKQAIENAFGKDGQNYFRTFLKDINGAQSVSRDTLGKSLLTAAKLASVGANLRVIALQPTSYVRALAVLNPAYMLKASAYVKLEPITMIPKLMKAVGKAEKYCGMALWKSLGYYDTNIQKGVTEQIKHKKTGKDRLVEWSMKGAELADKATFGTLWIACEFEIKGTRKDLRVGSEEYYKAVGKKLREVIYATQVVDSTMTRSQMMRSSDDLDKVITSFMSEPTLSYNMALDAIMQFNLDKRKNGIGYAVKKNAARIARIATAYTMTNAIAALVESAFDALRSEEDDEDGMDIAEFMDIYFSNFKSDMSLIGKIPLVKDVISIFEGYNASPTYLAAFESTYYAIEGWKKVITTDKGNPTKALKHSVKALSYLTGLPFYNFYRDTTAILDKTDKLPREDFEESFNEWCKEILPHIEEEEE